jgi:hypothetical protein
MYQFKSVLTGVFYLLIQFAVAEHSVNEIITHEIVKEQFCKSTRVTTASFTFYKNPAFTCCVQKTKPENMKNKTIEIKGIYTLVPNPCLTQPCLPGMAGAVKTGEGIYFLLKDGHFTDDGFFWEDVSPQHGDTLIINGIPDTMTDVKGEEFKVMKMISIIKLN